MNKIIFENCVERWSQTVKAMRKVAFSPDDCRFVMKPPATLQEVLTVEETLGFKIPESLRDFISNFSAGIDFFWFLRDFTFPSPLDFINHGDCSLDLNELVYLEKDRQRWLSFSNNDDKAYDIIREKFVFMTVGNGDRIAIDLSKGSYGKVIYLACHFEDEEGHGYFLGENFIDFIDRWTQVGCVGPEIWQMIEFIDSPTSYIDPNNPNAVELQRVLQI